MPTMRPFAIDAPAVAAASITGGRIVYRDLDGTLARHSPDILMFDVPEPIQARGLAEYRETWELFSATARAARVRSDCASSRWSPETRLLSLTRSWMSSTSNAD
jgi:hypothetical protein